jgi:hypothetical protein
VTPVELVAVPAVAVNVAVEAPPGTDTFAGTASNVEEVVRATTIPPLGAGPVRDTVPVPERVFTIVPGLIETFSNAAGLTVSVAETERDGPVAVMTAVVVAVTTLEVTVKAA